MSSARQLQSGGLYRVPPKPQGLAPDLPDSLDSWQQTVSQAAQMISDKTGRAATVADGMVRAYQVTTPTNIKTACLLTCLAQNERFRVSTELQKIQGNNTGR